MASLGHNELNNGLLPVLHQAIVLPNADILWTEPVGTNFREIWIKIQFSSKKISSKMAAILSGLNVLMLTVKPLIYLAHLVRQ